MNTGEIIKTLRKEKGLTQEEVGKHLGITKSAIQKYESGEVKNIKLETIQKLCLLFDITPISIIFPEYAHFKNIQLSKTINHEGIDFIQCFSALNRTGKLKVADYTRDLLKIPYYTVQK